METTSGQVSWAMCEELEWPYVLVLMLGIGVVLCADWLTEWARANYAAGSKMSRWYARRIPPWSAGAAGGAAVFLAGVSSYHYLAAGCVPLPIPVGALILGIVSGLLASVAIVRLLVARIIRNSGDGEEPSSTEPAGGFFVRVRLSRRRARALIQYVCLSALATLLAGIAFGLM